MQAAQEEARTLIESDPELDSHPETKRMLEGLSQEQALS
jgi:hypothetical protein